MAFTGNLFLFDGIPSDYYHLILYSFEPSTTEENDSGAKLEIVEDRTSRSCYPIHYGCLKQKPLTFEMVFGSLQPLDKYDVEQIVSWLTEHEDYCELEIIQPDLSAYKYRCLIADLKTIHINGLPIAFRSTVICDSPYAYTYPQEYNFTIENTKTIQLYNESNASHYLYPKMSIKPKEQVKTISLQNHSDGDRICRFDGLSGAKNLEITVDNQRQIITANNKDDLYNLFNGNFFRLAKGMNQLTVSGDCTLQIICEFPKKVGG